MKRYSILVKENGNEYTLCQVDDNPQEIVAAAEQKTKLVYLSGGGSRRSAVPKYSSVRFVENKA